MEFYIKYIKNDVNDITYLSEFILDIKDVKDLIPTATYVSAKKIGGSANALWRTLYSFHKWCVH